MVSPEVRWQTTLGAKGILLTFVRGLAWTVDFDIEVPQVLLVRHGADSWHTATQQCMSISPIVLPDVNGECGNLRLCH
jgi:hypothetical protein